MSLEAFLCTFLYKLSVRISFFTLIHCCKHVMSLETPVRYISVLQRQDSHRVGSYLAVVAVRLFIYLPIYLFSHSVRKNGAVIIIIWLFNVLLFLCPFSIPGRPFPSQTDMCFRCGREGIGVPSVQDSWADTRLRALQPQKKHLFSPPPEATRQVGRMM